VKRGMYRLDDLHVGTRTKVVIRRYRLTRQEVRGLTDEQPEGITERRFQAGGASLRELREAL
jgi:hypothetical protein